jgi:Cdc6-like AAA superfamily ATPase
MLASVVLLVELPLWSLFICRQPTQTKRAIIVDGEPGAMQDDELVFDPYDASQLREILERRTDAFADSVLKGDVIPTVAALAAKEHDDARKVVDTPCEAGRLAEKQGVETVTVDHVDDAVQRAEVNRFEKLLRGTPTSNTLCTRWRC